MKDLSKREYFAAMAMQGLLSDNFRLALSERKVLSEWSVKCADALIEELEKNK